MYDKKGENKETNINLSGKEMIKKNPMKIQLVAADDRTLAEVIKSATGASKASINEYTKAIKSLGIANEKAMAMLPLVTQQQVIKLNLHWVFFNHFFTR